MAHRPRHGNPWLSFLLEFVRTPRRLGYTLIGIFVILILVYPYGAALTLSYLLNNVLLILLPSVIMIGCILWGFRLMFKPLAPKKKKKDH
jgi:hypothetical protein